MYRLVFYFIFIAFCLSLEANESRFPAIFGGLSLAQTYSLCVDEVDPSDIETCVDYGFSYETFETRFVLNDGQQGLAVTKAISLFGQRYKESSDGVVCTNCKNRKEERAVTQVKLPDMLTVVIDKGFKTKRVELNGKKVNEPEVENHGELISDDIKYSFNKEARYDPMTKALFSLLDNAKHELVVVYDDDGKPAAVVRPSLDNSDMTLVYNIANAEKIINAEGKEGITFSGDIMNEEFDQYLKLVKTLFDDKFCTATAVSRGLNIPLESRWECFQEE